MLFLECFFRVASFSDLDFAIPDVTNDPLFGDVTLNALLGSNTDLTLQEGSLFNIRNTIEFGSPYTVLQFDFLISGAREINLAFDTVNGIFSSTVKYKLLNFSLHFNSNQGRSKNFL